MTLDELRSLAAGHQSSHWRVAGPDLITLEFAELTALLDAAAAAANLRAHIEGGMESRTHLPDDLCFRQVKTTLDHCEAVFHGTWVGPRGCELPYHDHDHDQP